MDRTGWLPGERLLVSLLILVAAGLRLYQLDAPLWFDEITTLTESVRQPLIDILTRFPSNNNHVAFSALANLSIAAFGEHAWSLRLPAAAFGVGSIYVLYLFGREIAGRFEGFVAALLATISYHHIWFSQNARGYTILLFCTILATHLLWLGMNDGRRSRFVAYALICVLAVYTHLTMVFAVAAHAVVFAARQLAVSRGRIVIADWINPAIAFGLAAVLSIAIYLPMLGDLQAFFLAAPAAPVAPVAAAAAPESETVRWALIETIRGLGIGALGWWAIAAALVVLATGGISYLKQSLTLTCLFAAPAVAVVAATVLLDRPIYPRFFFFVAGFAILVVVRGVMVWCRVIGRQLPPVQRWLPYAAAAAMVLVGLVMLPPAYLPKQDYETAHELVRREAAAGDAIALAGIGAAPIFQDYFHEPWPRLNGAEELARLRRSGHPTTWVIYSLPTNMRINEAPLLAAITDTCTERAEIGGTMADGAIVISKCAPAP
jgi:uncharacterized membrane protein